MKSVYLALFVALVVSGLIATGFQCRITSAEPTSLADRGATKDSAHRAGRAAIEAALNEKTSIDLAETMLCDAIQYLEKKHGLQIQFDYPALKDASPPIDPTTTPITRMAKDISLRSALRLMLDDHGLTYVIKDEVMQITTKEVADKTLRTKAYDVTDLLKRDEAAAPDFHSLTELIKSTVSASSWDDTGGLGTLEAFGQGTLVVSQTDDVHEQVAGLLAALRRVQEQIKVGSLDVVIPFDEQNSRKSVQRKLDETVALDFREVPLSDTVSYISDTYGIPIQFDFAALKDAAPSIDPTTTPITRKVSGISLRSALNLMLNDYGLTAVVRNEQLMITTKEIADKTLETRIYPVNDLAPQAALPKDSIGEDRISRANELARVIKDSASASSWSDNGGLGTIEPYDKGGLVFVISQTQEVHDQVADLLTLLRDVNRQQQNAAAARQSEPERMVLRVYDLRMPEPKSPTPTPQEMAEVVKSLVETKSWGQGEAYIRGITGKLVVRQLPSVHRQIEAVLKKLEPPSPAGAGGGKDAKPASVAGGLNAGGGGF